MMAAITQESKMREKRILKMVIYYLAEARLITPDERAQLLLRIGEGV